jgi:hypothetical protein
MQSTTVDEPAVSVVASVSDGRRPPRGRVRPPDWGTTAVLVGVASGLTLFFVSLNGIRLSKMNGLGILSVMPGGAIAGVALVATALIVGISLGRVRPLPLGLALVALVVCLDGLTAFVESEPRFPTAYQIVGYVDYISKTGHSAPDLAAYFSWPGFFALISLVTGAAGAHGLLPLVRWWPVLIDLAYLPPLFLLMRGLRMGWRAKWLAAFFFVVGNWVGQDYFSPQSFGLFLYIVFVAILLNWFIDVEHHPPWALVAGSRLARAHRRLFGTLRPGERAPRPTTAGQQTLLLGLLVALFTVATASHQLTPFFMLGACVGLTVTRRSQLVALPVLLAVILAGYISFATVDYWSGHLTNILSGIGHLGGNVTSSVGSRIAGGSPAHETVLHARVAMAAVVAVLAGLGLVRRRRQGFDDRVLMVLVVTPVVLIGVVSYGGEIALRTYLFLLPAACPLAASLFFPRTRSVPRWRPMAIVFGCALVLPLGFILTRYGNETYEQIPAGELAATNWVYAHDADGVRLLWLSTSPSLDDTPEMPWSYRDLTKVDFIPTQAPRHPADISGIVAALRQAGPGSYLIAAHTQEVANQQTASYPAGWGGRFATAMKADPDVRTVFVADDAVLYTLAWPAGARPRPLPGNLGRVVQGYGWTELGLVVFYALVLVLALIELTRLWRRPVLAPRTLWTASGVLVVLLLGDIVLRIKVLS